MLQVVVEVAFVDEQDFADILFGVFPNFVQPLGDVVEGRLVTSVGHQHYRIGTSVVSVGDGPVSLLAGRVPNLQLNILFGHLEGSKPEVDPNGGDVVLRESVVSETDEEARFAHIRVPDDDYLEKVVIVPFHCTHLI